jgi:hypothetical protein
MQHLLNNGSSTCLTAGALSLASGNRPFRLRQHPHLPRFAPECLPVIDPKPGLSLPLVYHLVQQGVLDLGPCMPRDVAPADGDIEWAAGPDFHCELAKAAAHAAREPDRDLAQNATEVLRVELPMQALQPVEQPDISRPGALSPLGLRPGRRILMDRKRQELLLGPPAQRPGHPRVQEPDDGLEHTIGGKRIPLVNSENTSIEAEQYDSVGMSKDLVDFPETEGLKPGWETVLKSRGLPRCPAASLPRLTHSP